ncbi:hypothetical protein FCR2A7T_22420 [Flavobacterium cauense R2A-7]|uniref:VWA domain-containing protein n=1 Tax=Flavobacterium cauense R2A-7 TaxID=1341154 RepID=V6RXD8_9FLAO|nr:hypothetical protein [Flavobacterium cauense]ESU18839.1 hypothetical protein FCR2A7T_22420 [Flavobacterium cauense R2A-7]KGO81695.1 hypothetical protein Q762_07560 [Flavobacterium cauense R2A-7]TWI13723.1 hypothetical protein IP98_00869 [Flavobacterium cauense R2A-7]
MTTSTILLLLLSVLIAAGLSFYHYLYKANYKSKLHLFLAFLRFVSLFSIFVLLINPIISRKTFETTKTPLPIVVDNSQSIKELSQDNTAKELSEKLTRNSKLNEKYDVQLYRFDSDFQSGNELDFKGKQTHIDQAAQNLKQFYRSQHYPVVLLTDGNQTIGNDYVYSFQQNTSVYPLILGDTTSFFDLKINQLNVNKYAFLKNKFPVEVFLQYNGNKAVNATFIIQQGNAAIHKQTVAFSPSKKAQVVSVLLNADKVGVQTFKAVISSSEKEKNQYNNSKNFAVEVIDQRSEIALVSTINHPDLGALKRSIESNQQRKVTIVKPKEIKSLQDFNVLILYQPTNEFRSLLEQNKNLGLNTWMITGTNTDFNLLNQYQNQIQFKLSGQNEDYSADYNSQFNSFALDNIGFEQFTPLQHPFGTISVKENANTLLKARIRNITTENPLLTFSENGLKRNAYLFGENIWKWRMESHLKTKSFEQFDVFTDKIIQYLASNSAKKSLAVTHESFYNSGETIEITAQYFNKNYEFDENARLTIALKNKQTGKTKNFDFLKGNSEYKVNLDGLEFGNYSFTVTENNSKTKYSGTFEVLDFEIEKQFVNPDTSRLQQLASNTNGKVYYPSQVDALIEDLLKNQNYIATEKAIIKKTPLIDWIWLMVLLVVSLAAEWFTRKYNGLL